MRSQRLKFRPVLTATLAVFLLSFSLHTKAQEVLLVHAGFGAWASEVQAKILGTGSFTTVDIFNARFGTPTLAPKNDTYQTSDKLF